jgi:hypothetical protein
MNMDNSERTEVSAGVQSYAATVAEGSSTFVECAGKIPREQSLRRWKIDTPLSKALFSELDHQERLVLIRAEVEGFGLRRDHSGPGEVALRGGGWNDAIEPRACEGSYGLDQPTLLEFRVHAARVLLHLGPPRHRLECGIRCPHRFGLLHDPDHAGLGLDSLVWQWCKRLRPNRGRRYESLR